MVDIFPVNPLMCIEVVHYKGAFYIGICLCIHIRTCTCRPCMCYYNVYLIRTYVHTYVCTYVHTCII